MYFLPRSLGQDYDFRIVFNGYQLEVVPATPIPSFLYPMFYPYSSGYHIPSSPSFPGAWSSAWSLPQPHLEYEALEVAEFKRLLSLP
jgi:hypothetical protein